jgi:hypothetical protein
LRHQAMDGGEAHERPVARRGPRRPASAPFPFDQMRSDWRSMQRPPPWPTEVKGPREVMRSTSRSNFQPPPAALLMQPRALKNGRPQTTWQAPPLADELAFTLGLCSTAPMLSSSQTTHQLHFRAHTGGRSAPHKPPRNHRPPFQSIDAPDGLPNSTSRAAYRGVALSTSTTRRFAQPGRLACQGIRPNDGWADGAQNPSPWITEVPPGILSRSTSTDAFIKFTRAVRRPSCRPTGNQRPPFSSTDAPPGLPNSTSRDAYRAYHGASARPPVCQPRDSGRERLFPSEEGVAGGGGNSTDLRRYRSTSADAFQGLQVAPRKSCRPLGE